MGRVQSETQRILSAQFRANNLVTVAKGPERHQVRFFAAPTEIGSTPSAASSATPFHTPLTLPRGVQNVSSTSKKLNVPLAVAQSGKKHQDRSAIKKVQQDKSLKAPVAMPLDAPTPSSSSSASASEDAAAEEQTRPGIHLDALLTTDFCQPLAVGHGAAPLVKNVVAYTQSLIERRAQARRELARERWRKARGPCAARGGEGAVNSMVIDALVGSYNRTKRETLLFLVTELPGKYRRMLARLKSVEPVMWKSSRSFSQLLARYEDAISRLENLREQVEVCNGAMLEGTPGHAAAWACLETALEDLFTCLIDDKPGGPDDATALQLLSHALAENDYGHRVVNRIGGENGSKDREFEVFFRERTEARFVLSQYVASCGARAEERNAIDAAPAFDGADDDEAPEFVGAIKLEHNVYKSCFEVAKMIRQSTDPVVADLVEFDLSELDEELYISFPPSVFLYMVTELMKNANNASLRASAEERHRLLRAGRAKPMGALDFSAMGKAAYQTPARKRLQQHVGAGCPRGAAAPPRAVTVRSRTVRGELEGLGGEEMVAIDVIDEGCGLSADALERVFQFFYSDTDCDNLKLGGFGLGLSATRLFARQFGGNVQLRSVEGVCTVATLLLPKIGRGRYPGSGGERRVSL